MNVLASDFASLKDLAAFKAAKARGLSDEEAFKVGDNGEGCWGDFTATEDTAMCALPPDEWLIKWGPGEGARGKLVLVTYHGKMVVCELRDTMPHYRNITNGCGIDLNPGALKAFGLVSPIKVPVAWSWYTNPHPSAKPINGAPSAPAALQKAA